MDIAFCHHLSLGYFGGGEKWIISTAKELTKLGHNVEIYALPFLMEKHKKIDVKPLLDGIPYEEVKHKKIKADITYMTYNPLSWLNFETSHPRIAGIHSHAYWQTPNLNYGLLPNMALLTNKVLSYFELHRFDAIHAVTNTYPINHPNVYFIPNYVDSDLYHPCAQKESSFTIGYASRKVWQKGWDIFQLIEKEGNFNTKTTGTIKEEEMPEFFSSCHAVVVPSRVDTFGLTIVESAMCGTPVITSNIKTHNSLKLPLIFANNVKQYIDKIKYLKTYSNYNHFSETLRKQAMFYDKKGILEKINRMFLLNV